jgi:polysaccharide biosynthesis/export protein
MRGLILLLLVAILGGRQLTAGPDNSGEWYRAAADSTQSAELQTTGSSKTAVHPADRDARIPLTVNQEYVLGPGDVVEVTVLGIANLDQREFMLDGQGRVSLPYVGQVRLKGATAHEAELKIAALFEVSLIEDPQVAVRVKEFKSQYCYVLGAVQKPAKYQLTEATSLLDALTMAGGLTEKADTRILIYHGSGAKSGAVPPADSAEPRIIRLAELLSGGNVLLNITIESGDIVSVPERKESLYFVVGDIQKPGVFTMPTGEGVTISRALANAGGPLRTASGDKTLIIRKRPGLEMPEQIKVNAVAILRGEARDVELLENDIVLVPGSATKTLGKSLFLGLNYFLNSLLILGVR